MGFFEAAMRTLSRIMKMNLKLELRSQAEEVKAKLGKELLENFASVKILGGADDGRIFELRKNQIKIGRVDPENQDEYDPQNDIVFSNSYSVVTRVSKPHARLFLEDGQWYVEHCEGVNGTYLWERKLAKLARY